MTSGAPWSVKGIDPKAREVAKDLARRSGMNLGEWLNRMILEDEGPEGEPNLAQAQDPVRNEALSGRDQAAGEPRSEERATRLTPDHIADQIARAAREPSSLWAQRDYLETTRAGAPAPQDPPPPPRVEAPPHPGDEIVKVLASVDRLAERIAAAEERSSAAIGGVEQSVREALARIESSEREQVAVAARFEGLGADLAAGQEKLAERLRKYEADGAGALSVEALHALEQALGKVAGRVYGGEARTRETLDAVDARLQRLEAADAGDPALFADEVLGRLGARLAEAQAKTTDALDGLRASFAELDGRLGTVESDDQAPRLEDFAASLTSRLEAARSEITDTLNASASERFDRMDRRLDEMGQHLTAAEQRSAQAIEQMGRDVLSVADTFNRKIEVSEERSGEAIQKVGGEVARIASTVESRLGRAESVQAEALERLSGEIARITERLTERITAAERRSAHAVDEVGENVARVTEKLNARHERAAEGLAERIRQSEERTARLLDEARTKIDQRLAETQPSQPPPVVAKDRALGPFGGAGSDEIGPAEPDRGLAPIHKPEPLAAFAGAVGPAPASEPAFDEIDFDAAEGFEPEADGPALGLSAPRAPLIPQVRAEASQSSFDEDIGFLDDEPPVRGEATEAAFDDDIGFSGETEFLTPAAGLGALASEEEAPPVPATSEELDFPEAPQADAAADDLPMPAQEDEDLFEPVAAEPSAPLTTREIIEQARAAVRSGATADRNRGDRPQPESESRVKSAAALFSGFGLNKAARKRRKSGGALQTALLIAGGAAFLSVGAAGLVVMGAKPSGPPPQRVAESLEPSPAQIAEMEPSDAPFGESPRASIALSPQSARADEAGAPDASLNLDAAFDAAVRALEMQEPGALEALQKTANLGYAPAQLFLASLYESGEGVKKDLVEARRWTERAARGGDRKAMHNAALYAFEGVGGQAKNPKLAAQWFRQAADLGLVDSQYNLGRLYEQGLGVDRNPAEAYKWYLIAARSGDEESRSSARRVSARLSGDAKIVAERTAAAFRSTSPATAAAASPTTSASVTVAQQALSRLGYYQGPRDGVASPALRMAVAAYQGEQGLPATGALDEPTVAKLSVFTR